MNEPAIDLMTPTLWQRDGWTARVTRNEEGDGWAVEMTRDGDEEPALVGPWTMGRDKKNPKPLDAGAFNTLIKTANDVLRRHEQQARARLRKSFSYARPDGTRASVTFEVAADEDDPHAILLVSDERTGEVLRKGRVSPAFRPNVAAVERYVASGDDGSDRKSVV